MDVFSTDPLSCGVTEPIGWIYIISSDEEHKCALSLACGRPGIYHIKVRVQLKTNGNWVERPTMQGLEFPKTLYSRKHLEFVFAQYVFQFA